MFLIITCTSYLPCMPYGGNEVQRKNDKFKSIIRLQIIHKVWVEIIPGVLTDFAFPERETMMYNLNEKSWRCFVIIYNVKVQLEKPNRDGKEFWFSEQQDMKELTVIFKTRVLLFLRQRKDLCKRWKVTVKIIWNRFSIP